MGLITDFKGNKKYIKMVDMGIFKGSIADYKNLSTEERWRLERFLKFFTDERIAKKVFSGTIEDFLKLTTLEQDKIIEMYKEKKIEQEYNNFKIETSYAGTLEDYLKLSYAEKDAIIDKHKEEERKRKERKNAEDSFNIIKKRTNYKGTFDDYLKLSDEERNKIKVIFLLNSYIADRNDCFKEIEKLYKEIISGNTFQKNYRQILELLELQNFYRQRYFDGIKSEKLSNESEIPKEFLSLVDTDIKKPKFGFFDNKKYKLLNNLLTDEYIYKLKTRQIASNFKNEADYNDKGNWKEFIDIKEREYQQLHNQRPPIYSGSFEEYLQESTLVTSEYLTHGYSYSKFQEQQELEKQRRIDNANMIFKIQSDAIAKVNSVMNGSSARALSQNAVDMLNQILSEGKKSESLPYSYKPGPKKTEEDAWSDDMSIDDILRRNANRR